MSRFSLFSSCLVTAAILTGCGTTELTTPRTETTYLRAPASAEIDFKPLFDGRSFNGWKLLGKKGNGYGIHNGILYCTEGGGGNLLTEKEYADFILRFEFRLDEGSNNGLAIRAPMAAKALAYEGMELQILDNQGAAKDGRKRRPTQLHGSLYDVAPAKAGALRPAGQWNEQEVTVDGRRIRVVLNGRTILDVNLNDITDPAVIKKHPGLFRERGHIGFLGHNDHVEFRNIRVKELPTARVYNRTAPGFDLLFDGVSLAGWSGIHNIDDSRGESAQAIAKKATDIDMRSHWSTANGSLTTGGAGAPIHHAATYANTELSLEYKADENATALVLLRGLPGVRIQGRNAPGNDPRLGSGGLHDGRFLYAAPKAYGDRFAGAWNRMRVLLVDNRAHVFINNQLVLKNAAFKNSGQPGAPLPETGAIGLFGEHGRIAFRSLQARSIGQHTPAPKPKPLPKTEPAPAPAPKPVQKKQPAKPKAPAKPVIPGKLILREAR